MTQERVLCVPARRFEQLRRDWPAGPFLQGDVGPLVGSLLASAVYRDRAAAESDPSWLQVIPYVLLRRGREVFRYRRAPSGGEGRLHGLWSVGVGGHVNDSDGSAGGPGAYLAGLRRELHEEVGVLLAPGDEPPPLGVIFDPADAVGRVHLGVVHAAAVTFIQELRFGDPALAAGHFQHAVELRAEMQRDPGAFEAWSRHAVGVA